MSRWIEVRTEVAGRGNHRVQLLADGGVLWEHDCPDGYPVRRHEVAPADGQTWQVVRADPLTLSPSLHCDPALGGCGMHGHIVDGLWT